MLPLIILGTRRAKKIIIPQIKFSMFYPTSPSVFCRNGLSSEIIWCFTLWWNSYYLTGECSPNFFDLIGKDPDAGKAWGQEEKGATEDEMVGWHHWLDGHEFEQALGDEGQGSLANAVHGVAKSWTWVSNWITTNNPKKSLIKNTDSYSWTPESTVALSSPRSDVSEIDVFYIGFDRQLFVQYMPNCLYFLPRI